MTRRSHRPQAASPRIALYLLAIAVNAPHLATRAASLPDRSAPSPAGSSSLAVRASFGLSPGFSSYEWSGKREVHPSGKLELDIGISLKRSGLGISAAVQFSVPFPLMTIEPGIRLTWDWWARPWFRLTPGVFVGASYLRSTDTDDGGFAGAGVAAHLGLVAGFRISSWPRASVGVRVFELGVQRWYPVGSRYNWHEPHLTALSLAAGGLLVMF